jgi:2-keto-3-deoxy-L-rhamnonate aldolase RhmA
MAQVGSTFRQRIKAGDDLVGTFLKTPTSHGAEIVGDLGFDFVVIDQEHAPFDRASTDVALLAARALNVPALVRVGGTETILSVLDCGDHSRCQENRGVVPLPRRPARLRDQHARRPLHGGTHVAPHQ